MATDNMTGCGSVALSWIQMMAASIISNDSIYRLNLLEVSDPCASLHDLVDCNTNHIEPERLLVENTFALDDCSSLMALKVFSNESASTDYSECGEIPKTFLEMLARTIVGFHDLVGNLHHYINVESQTDNCDDITPLLTCTTNAIEAERMLVENLFATDTCDRLLLKVFNNSGAAQSQDDPTDYDIACTETPQSLYQMLARCIVLHGDQYRLNIVEVTDNCDDITSFWTCSNNHLDPEEALVENLFTTDTCDNLAIKWFNNEGEA